MARRGDALALGVARTVAGDSVPTAKARASSSLHPLLPRPSSSTAQMIDALVEVDEEIEVVMTRAEG